MHLLIRAIFLILGTHSHCCARFGEGTGPILFKTPLCSGDEYRVSDCQMVNNTGESYHLEDWGVSCTIGI